MPGLPADSDDVEKAFVPVDNSDHIKTLVTPRLSFHISSPEPASGIDTARTIHEDGYVGTVLRLLRIFGALSLPLLIVQVIHSAAPSPSVTVQGFQEARAKRVLQEITVGPRPLGSVAGARAADRLAQHMREIVASAGSRSSASVEVQNFDVSAYFGSRGTNIIGIVSGSGPAASKGPSVMVSAHLDSVSAGPGATDDGVGVAVVVEAFRVFVEMANRRRLAYDVFFVLVDGEEQGCKGSKAFMQSEHGARVRVVLNLEGAGAATAEYLVRTNSPWLVDLYARSAPHPAAYSISEFLFGVYGNGYTDSEEYAKRGAHVTDLIFIENRFVYHTADDSFDNVAVGALQHEGDNVVSLLSQAASTTLPEAIGNLKPNDIRSDSIYFTVFRTFALSSNKLLFQIITVMLSLSTLLLLPRSSLWQALILAFSLVCGLFLQTVAAVIFVEPRDVRTWYWSGNTLRVLHPAAWLLLIVSLMQCRQHSDLEDAVGGSLLIAAILNLFFAFFCPDFVAASIWLLLPAIVPVVNLAKLEFGKKTHGHVDAKPRTTANASALWGFVGLLLVLDNVMSWIPAFLFFLDAMRSPVVASELFASVIAVFVLVLVRPIVASLKPFESQILLMASIVFVFTISVLEHSAGHCINCPRPA